MATLPDPRRGRLLRAALGCFARYGYRRTSMEVIAQAAGMSRPALYQYYRGKEEVFRAAARWGLDDLAARAEAAAEAGGEPGERARAVLGLVLRMYDVRGEPAGHFRAELIDETYARAGDLWRSFEERLLALLGSVLGTGAGIAKILLYGTKGIALHVEAPEEREELLRRFVEVTVRGSTS